MNNDVTNFYDDGSLLNNEKKYTDRELLKVI